jgi:beta-lactam-binding protein with PASTA domain
MSIVKFLISKTFLKNLSFILAAFALLLVTVFISLSIYTHHGEAKPLPDFKGLTEGQFKKIIKDNDLKYKIIDSVHVADKLPGVVVEQTPKAGEKVKRNRTIFFTINALTTEKVQMPNVVESSLRDAKVTLESYGLRTGKIIYVPSEYTNLVMGQMYKGKPIEKGTSIPKGSRIDLMIGKGLSDKKTNVPDLTAMSMDKAEQVCLNTSLNIGAIICDTTLKTAEDSLNAFVWKQRPKAEEGTKLNLGASIDIWVTLDSLKLLSDSAAMDIQGQNMAGDTIISTIGDE